MGYGLRLKVILCDFGYLIKGMDQHRGQFNRKVLYFRFSITLLYFYTDPYISMLLFALLNIWICGTDWGRF
jgi:hypothetical protein